MSSITIAYQKTFSHLTKRLIEDLGDKVESIVLYGSVARNEAREDSDIDVLVVTRDDDRKLYDRISKIRTRIDLSNNTLTTLVQISRKELEQHMKLGSPFMESVVKEGIILYDSGFLKKIRGSLAFKG
jgi:predicted nucleotidyltransferase